LGQQSGQQKQASEARQAVETGLSYVKLFNRADIPGETDLGLPQSQRDAVVRRFLDVLDAPPFVEPDSKRFRDMLIVFSPEFEISNTARASMSLEHKIELTQINSGLKGLILHATSEAEIDTTAKLWSLPPSESSSSSKREAESWLLLCHDCPVVFDASMSNSASRASAYSTELIPAGSMAEELASANKSIEKFGLRVLPSKQTRAIRLRIYYQ